MNRPHKTVLVESGRSNVKMVQKAGTGSIFSEGFFENQLDRSIFNSNCNSLFTYVAYPKDFNNEKGDTKP